MYESEWRRHSGTICYFVAEHSVGTVISCVRVCGGGVLLCIGVAWCDCVCVCECVRVRCVDAGTRLVFLYIHKQMIAFSLCIL